MLDRNRSFATFSPNPENIRYEQDGVRFYYDGKPVIEEVPKKEATKPAPKKRGRKPAKKD